MTTSTTPGNAELRPTAVPLRARFRWLVPISLVALGLMLVQPAIASAAPREWDVGAYDDCVKAGINAYKQKTGAYIVPISELNNIENACCYGSGGLWWSNTCHAPPENGDSGPTRTLPAPPSTQILVPGNPPPANNPG